jgi:hypothetical protein
MAGEAEASVGSAAACIFDLAGKVPTRVRKESERSLTEQIVNI